MPAALQWDIIWRLVVTGLGQGLFQSPNARALMGSVPQSAQGTASGLLSTGRVPGQSLSVALAGSIFASLGGATAGALLEAERDTLSPASVSALQATFVSSFRAARLCCAGLAMLGVLTAAVRGTERKRAR